MTMTDTPRPTEPYRQGRIRVDPTLAQRWLQQNHGNRRIIENTVNKYAEDMAAGRWLYTGDPIQFAEDGTLLNGQHRLAAIVKSGTTIPLDVVNNLPKEAQMVMDSGKARTPAQQLMISGVANASGVAALARVLIRWEAGNVIGKTITPSTAQIVEYVDHNHEQLQRAVRTGLGIRAAVRVSPTAISAVCYRALEMSALEPGKLPPEDVDAFFHSLQSGANLSAGDPILVFRNVVPNRARDLISDLYYLVRTWNAYRKHERLTTLQLPRDSEVTQQHLRMVFAKGASETW